MAKAKAPKKAVKKVAPKKAAKRVVPKKATETESQDLSFFLKKFAKSEDKWVKPSGAPDNWKRQIIAYRIQAQAALKTAEIPAEIKKLLSICIDKSIVFSWMIEEDENEYFEIVEKDHDDSDYKRYYHLDVIHFKEHDVFIKQDIEGVHERPPYNLKYSVVETKMKKSWL